MDRKQINKNILNYYKKYPWRKRLAVIKQRCNNPNNKSYKDYGQKGIKCLITSEELRELWFRDKAYNMNKPSIDRIDNDGNYEYTNCRFIEIKDNICERNKRLCSKSILQYDLDGNFIREWESISNASKKLNLNPSNIVSNLKDRHNSCGGFKWSYT